MLDIRSLGYQFRSTADRSKRYSERHFKILGAIAVVVIPATTLIERAVAEPAFNTVYVRLLAGVLGLPLLFHDRLPPAFQRNLEFVWICTATLILPFCYGCILTLNATLLDDGAAFSSIWIYQYLVALFIFIQLINNGPLAVFLWGFATLLVFAVSLVVSPDPNVEALRQAWLFPLPVYLTVLFIANLTNRNLHVVQTEQLRAAAAIGSNIAHELRTPLASIRTLARGINRFLPDLIKAYESAKSAQLDVALIENSRIEQIRMGLTTIQAEVDYSNTAIDMLLMNTSDRPVAQRPFQVFPVSIAIEEAIARFPFNNSSERGILNCAYETDFLVDGPRVLVVHVVFNLLKNGLYHVQKTPGGVLTVRCSTVDRRHLIEVTDTGPGIPPSIQPMIFDRFFTEAGSNQGAGIGLSFCKMVMESIGGEIHCESREGEFTTFRLVFPAVSHGRRKLADQDSYLEFTRGPIAPD